MSRNNMGTMKTIQIIAAVFCLQSNVLFAANPKEGGLTNDFSKCVNCSLDAPAALLAPATPLEATFSDDDASMESNLAPWMPSEATFEDSPANLNMDIPENLAPVSPAEATFDENPPVMSIVVPENLAPATPAEADFND